MNKQIDHLIYESGLIARGCWDKFDDYDKAALNKFAELIVQECIDILSRPDAVMKLSQKELSNYNQGWVNGRLLGIEHIQKHFEIKNA